LPINYKGGDTVSVSNPNLTGIDTNSNLVSTPTSSVTGNSQHVFYQAPSFAFTSGNATVTGSDPNTSPAHTNDVVDATIAFTVTANNSDIYIPTVTNDSSTDTIKLTGLSLPASSSLTWTCNSPVDNTTNEYFWRIPSGNTVACTVSYHGVNTGGKAGYYQLALNQVIWGLGYNSSNEIATSTTQGYGFENVYKTNTFYLGN
jgi:hypothetical protein